MGKTKKKIKGKHQITLFEMFDIMAAETLNISVDEYVRQIEKTTEGRIYIIVNGLLSEDEKKIEKAIRCFKLIK